jgi:hypothetical protein
MDEGFLTVRWAGFRACEGAGQAAHFRDPRRMSCSSRMPELSKRRHFHHFGPKTTHFCLFGVRFWQNRAFVANLRHKDLTLPAFATEI